METVLKSVIEITGGDSTSLELPYNSDENVVFEYSKNSGEVTSHRRIARLISGISGDVLKDEEIVFFQNNEIESDQDVFDDNKLKAVIAAPVKFLKDKKGILYIRFLESDFNQDFRKSLKKRLEFISRIISVAISRFHINKTLNDDINDLKIKYDFYRILSRKKKPENLSITLFDEIKRRFGYEDSRIYVFNREEDELVLRYASGKFQSDIGKSQKTGSGSLQTEVLEQGKSLYISDISREDISSNLNEKRGSVFILPLIDDGKNIGVMEIYSSEEENFPDDTRKVLEAISEEISVFLERTLRYKRAVERSRRDHLTGVINRRELEIEIKKTIARSRRYENKFSILFIDFDNFKHFNDKYGHSHGDKTLKHYTSLCKSVLRTGDLFGRYGGDEFLAVLHLADVIAAEEVTKRLLEKIRKDKNYPTVSLSGGIAVFPQDGEDFDTLINVADNACYHAKNNGGDRFVIGSNPPRGIIF